MAYDDRQIDPATEAYVDELVAAAPPLTEAQIEAAVRLILAGIHRREIAAQAAAAAEARAHRAKQQPIGAMKSTPIWLNTRQTAERTGRHQVTVRAALAAGELHGGQRKSGASWRIHADCADAWAGGRPCSHRAGAT